MKLFINSLIDNKDSSKGFFEDIFLNNSNYEESKVRIEGNYMYTHDIFDTYVMVAQYKTDVGDDTGESINLGYVGIYNRDDGQPNGLGSYIQDITRSPSSLHTAYRPGSSAHWYPYHYVKNFFAESRVCADVVIDGVAHPMLNNTLALQSYSKITITQDKFGIQVLDGEQPPPVIDKATDGIMDVHSLHTITPQQLIVTQDFEVTRAVYYPIGYNSMISNQPNVNKYHLIENGNKVILPSVDGTIVYNLGTSQFGFNSDLNYGCALIADPTGLDWVGGEAERILVTSSSGTKNKNYTTYLRADTPQIGAIFSVTDKWIWGRSDGFMDIWNNAPIETL